MATENGAVELGSQSLSTEQTPKGAAGDGPPASEKEPSPPATEKDLDPTNMEKDPGVPDPKKNSDPPSLKKDPEAPGPEKKGDPAPASASSQGPSGEGDGGGGPAEGSLGPPAALPQPTATAEASIQKLDAKQAPSGNQGPGEPKAGKKAAECREAGRRASPAFLHSPSCPAIISW